MLPDIDGVEICRRIRQRSDLPVLMLTARDEDVDKIIGLEVGADDYLTKPFNPRELVARVKSILRRAAPERKRPESREIKHGDLVVNSGSREVHVGDEEIQLAPKEFDLLWELLDHRGLVLTRDQLLERVWGYTFAGRHADGGRSRPPDPAQARGRVADRDRLGRRLQGRAASGTPRRRRSLSDMFRSLRFRLPALFLVGIVLSGLISTLIAVKLFQDYARGRKYSELEREATGLALLYSDQAGAPRVLVGGAGQGDRRHDLLLRSAVVRPGREAQAPAARRTSTSAQIDRGRVIRFTLVPPGQKHEYYAAAAPVSARTDRPSARSSSLHPCRSCAPAG